MKNFILKTSKYGFLILLVHSILALIVNLNLFSRPPKVIGDILNFPWELFWGGAIGSCGYMGSSRIFSSNYCGSYGGIINGILVVVITYFIFGAIVFYLKKTRQKNNLS